MAKHRTAEEQERFRKLDAARAAEAAAKAARPNLFASRARRDGHRRRPRHAGRRGARSLFKKQTRGRRTAPTTAYRTTARSLFRKNSLDEMTVRRTEKPVDGVKPVKREKVGIGSYEDPGDVRKQGRRSKKSGRPGH